MAGNRYGLPSGFDATLKPSVSELTGIEGLEIQDVCITESMGPITDRAFEHLVPSDIMVARTRRRLLHAATALRDEGTIPPRVDAPAAYASVPGADSPTLRRASASTRSIAPGRRRRLRAKRRTAEALQLCWAKVSRLLPGCQGVNLEPIHAGSEIGL